MANLNPIKDKDDDAVKEANLKHIAQLSKAEKDQDWLKHGGPFGTRTFGFIDGNGNGDGDAHEDNKPKIIPLVPEEDIDFIIATIKKEAAYDEPSIKQLFYGMCTAFTKLGMGHKVKSKDSGSGKSYLTISCWLFS